MGILEPNQIQIWEDNSVVQESAEKTVATYNLIRRHLGAGFQLGAAPSNLNEIAAQLTIAALIAKK